MRVGPYEVVGPLGEGGMGEVYRARDTKLRREVALKVLPEVCACHPERLARFEREAHALAALKHPHIATIYGLHGEPVAGGASARHGRFVFVKPDQTRNVPVSVVLNWPELLRHRAAAQ
jgi:serine/threonine protein kinase